MKKKLFITAIILAFFSLFFVSFSSANTNMDNAVNSIRNFVGGTENMVENVGQDVANGVKNGMNTVENGSEKMTNGMENAMNNMGTSYMNGNNGYTATRTSTDTGSTGIFGNVTNNVWTWAILAVVGIVIVSLVMYYAKQSNITTYNSDDSDEDE